MPIAAPFNIKKWIDENRHLLKPPVGNQQIFKVSEDYIVMVVGGPNARKDYHFEDGEELFYQLEGDIKVKIQEDGQAKTIEIKEGEMWLLPPHVPHSPQRGANTIGLVFERVRREKEMDSCMWFCESCNNKLYEEVFPLKDIVTQLPKVMNAFYASLDLRTCKKCGSVMEPPAQPK
ncbi:MAG TPA: 3-hydroxyanthranilate 3,4-dioxygenase [Bacteroidia bacterium]|nr:3-hydroxyanthranilate 3,4-dioxygenase [Bacteroidia bacterium]HNU34748.1 3-hydroxyanthranilate 3,4-dioxygenase [Bacteroidia bacterium]